MTCRICETRRPRRYCPGVRGDICSICCGKEREVTVDCPLDCEYLEESRIHDRPPGPNPDNFPNADIRVNEKFLYEHQEMLMFASMTLFQAAMQQGAVDFDVREALDSLIRTYRTLQSGLYYESRPSNPYAAAIYDRLQQGFKEYGEMKTKRAGVSVRDAEIMGVLAFLQRMEITENNGRRRGRAFIDSLRAHFGTLAPDVAPSSLIT